MSKKDFFKKGELPFILNESYNVRGSLWKFVKSTRKGFNFVKTDANGVPRYLFKRHLYSFNLAGLKEIPEIVNVISVQLTDYQIALFSRDIGVILPSIRTGLATGQFVSCHDVKMKLKQAKEEKIRFEKIVEEDEKDRKFKQESGIDPILNLDLD